MRRRISQRITRTPAIAGSPLAQLFTSPTVNSPSIDSSAITQPEPTYYIITINNESIITPDGQDNLVWQIL